MNTFRSTQDQGTMKCLPFYEQSKRERLNQKMGGIKFDPANDSFFFGSVCQEGTNMPNTSYFQTS